MAAIPWYPLEWDVNHDSSFTISDIALGLQQMFFLPGDWAIWTILSYSPEISRFFELDESAYGGPISALVSLLVWMFVIVCVMTVTHYVAAADRAVTRVLRVASRNALIELRANRRRFGAWMRRAGAGSTGTGLAAIDALGLTNEELRVLSAHVHLRPPATLALSDLVRATGVPRTQVTSILDRLIDLRLLAVQACPEPDSRGYVLTEPGREIATYQRLSVPARNR